MFTLAVQETLDALRIAMRNTRILCAVMLDTKVGTASPPCGLPQGAVGVTVLYKYHSPADDLSSV